MPLYDYKCSACAKVTEVRHGFDEVNAQVCPACGGALRRVFNAAPILFKGSGFYINDSRPKPAGASASTPPDSNSPEAKSSEPATGDAKPSDVASPSSPAPTKASSDATPKTPAPSESKPSTSAA